MAVTPATPRPCDLCGTLVRVVSDREGTSHYEALPAESAGAGLRERITFDGHDYVHVAACQCPAMQAEVERLAATPVGEGE